MKVGGLELVVVTTALFRLSGVVRRLCDVGLRRLLWLVNPHRMVSIKRWLAIAPDWRKWRGDQARPSDPDRVSIFAGFFAKRKEACDPRRKGQRQGVHSYLLSLPFECSSSHMSLAHTKRSCTSRSFPSCTFIMSRASHWIVSSMRTVFCTLNYANSASVFSTSMLITLNAEIPYQ